MTEGIGSQGNSDPHHSAKPQVTAPAHTINQHPKTNKPILTSKNPETRTQPGAVCVPYQGPAGGGVPPTPSGLGHLISGRGDGAQTCHTAGGGPHAY
jgi:hypothetical protein